MGKNQRLKVHRQWLPGRSLCSIRSNRKWCKRRGSSLECQNCFFVYPIIDSNLKNLSLSCTYNFSSKWLHHLKNDSIRVSEIKSSAFPKSLCPKVEILRFRQALHMIFDKGFVNRINVIRVKAYF